MLRKLRPLEIPSWNLIGQDPEQFRHYGPMAQDFFAAFGKDAVGTIGTSTTINSNDLAGILMIAVQALEKRTRENAELKVRVEELERAHPKDAFRPCIRRVPLASFRVPASALIVPGAEWRGYRNTGSFHYPPPLAFLIFNRAGA